MNGRYFTLNAIIRVMQIEPTQDTFFGDDEFSLHNVETVSAFRDAVTKGDATAKITWAFSWMALNDQSENYMQVRDLVKKYHYEYGDDVTFFVGGYFANAYAPRDQVNKEMHDGITKVSEFIGDSFRPKSIIAGFLSAYNMEYLAKHEDIHVCQGTIWSQYSIDLQDGEGSLCYPYYPSTEHFCKPAQGVSDFVDCVNLDGWTVDFLAARREGFSEGFNSRMGVGPIETLGAYSTETAMKEIKHTTSAHFNEGYNLNGFGWVTVAWEICLVKQIGKLECLTQWIAWMKSTWDNVSIIPLGEFGVEWRRQNPDNHNLNYHFIQGGCGVGGSDTDKAIEWYMNDKFRLALLTDLKTDTTTVIDFTPYNITAKEPDECIRNWSLLGTINQKGVREQDKPIPFNSLPNDAKDLISQKIML